MHEATLYLMREASLYLMREASLCPFGRCLQSAKSKTSGKGLAFAQLHANITPRDAPNYRPDL